MSKEMQAALVLLCKGLGQALIANPVPTIDRPTSALLTALADYVRAKQYNPGTPLGPVWKD